MRVIMRAVRVMQEAGRERVLHVGRVYDLPQAVAESFLSSGVATVGQPAAVREVAAVGGAPERKRGRR